MRPRLVAVIVRPVFVLDDGETLKPVEHPEVTIVASDWPTYSSELFPQQVEAWEKTLNMNGGTDGA